MAGTVLKKLSSTHVTDNTAITAANSGFSSVNIPTGTTFAHLDASKMAGTEGYQATQSGANTPFAYLDLDAAVTKMAIRMPFRYAATPTASSVVLRGYTDATHAGTPVWSFQFTATNRFQFTEGPTGGLNVLSASATPMVPGNDYYCEMLVDADNAALTANVYDRGSTTAKFSLTGTLVFPGPMQSIRYGIGGPNAMTELNTNDNFAVGSGAMLARTDIATAALALTASLTPAGSPSTADTAVSRTLTINATGGSGNSFAVTVDWGDGLTADSTTMVPGTAKTLSRTPSVAGSKTITITYPTAG